MLQVATSRAGTARLTGLMVLLLMPARAAVAQQAGVRGLLPDASTTTRATAVAAFAATPPIVDGRDDDPVWSKAALITAFRLFDPVEDGDPTFRTTGRIAHDAHNLYVFLRAYDPHPDSIITMLGRRDAFLPSDEMTVLIDSYHDRRTGYEFDVNPSGVKYDASLQSDGDQQDPAWDGVWDVQTRIDSLGWTAEYRIPLAQLGYRFAERDTFGIYLGRRTKRLGEAASWPLHRRTLPGLVSQFGNLVGLDGLAPPRQLALVPYVVTSNLPRPGAAGRRQQASLGGDITVALPPTLRLDATVNPDFGQVEADPAELNLTAFETFFSEHRPFFVNDAGQFSASLNCGQYSCPDENLFYSRRIGRAPQLRGVNGDANSPAATRILGAGKLLGRVRGLTVGVLGAATERVNGPTGLAIEPAARYGVIRASEDLRHGESGLGFTVTGVERSLDASSAPYLHRGAYAAGLEFRHRFLAQYVISGAVDWSRITGSPAAIAATQRDPIHNYQRPDGALTLDTMRTSLTGDDERLAFDKLGGVVQFEGIYTRRSPGFEVNDLGFLRQADQQTAYGWLGLVFNRPTRLYRSFSWNLNTWWWATTAGLVTNRGINTNLHWTLHNMWRLGAWVTSQNLGPTFCDLCARGGPALRQEPLTETWFDIRGDDRNRLVPRVTITTSSTDRGRSTSWSVAPTATLNASSRFSASLGIRLAAAHNHSQWLENVVDAAGQTHYAFAHLDLHTVGITFRADYTLSPTLSLQAYAQPFASWGRYSDVRELADPRAGEYDARFAPYAPPGGSPAGVSARQLNANVVLRWEYHPGSTLFLVWTQARQAFSDDPGSPGLWGNLRGIFDQRADNTLLLKASYRLKW